MAQKLFQSVRRLPGHLNAFRKKPEVLEVHGNQHKVNVCAHYGFPSKPISISYDPILDLIALISRDGNLYVYGKPGVFLYGTHEVTKEFIQVVFIIGTRKLITLTDSDDIHLWELVSSAQSSVRLVKIFCIHSITDKLNSTLLNVNRRAVEDAVVDQCHITSLCCTVEGNGFLFGTDHGWIVSVPLNINPHPSKDFEHLTKPSTDNAITPSRILNCLSPDRRDRFRFDAVVVLSERPGFAGQLLIGYNSGLSLIFDLHADQVVAILPWQHGLESASWCGGNGYPNRVLNNKPTENLGTRLLTAHSDGSLGVWNLNDIGFPVVTASTPNPPILQMEEAPSMPYGPFPCKMISKVFWLPSPHGGITAFVGGMPRSTHGERHTVSVLRGSNIDRAATANVVAAQMAVAAELGGEDEDDEEDLLNTSCMAAAAAPIHVFDPDAPEHICFDLSSRLVDLLPVGPIGGSAEMLLLLCEEELVVVDLLTSGWPFMRPPYLACLHTATITTYSLITQVSSRFLSHLEAAGAHYGPEGRLSRGGAVIHNQSGAGWSQRPWPIQGGQALVSGSRLSASTLSNGLLFTDDLLITGHEDGSVAFWRISAGGCLRRLYTLHSTILFDFGLQNNVHDLDDDGDAWPPFRQAGVFDPFLDDNRASVQLLRLIDGTLTVGGAAGQVTVWQFLNFTPSLKPLKVSIKEELPGFQWKGHTPLRLRPGLEKGASFPVNQTSSPAQLQPVGVLTTHPPARITALNLSELKPSCSETVNGDYVGPIGSAVILSLGTPHGYGAVYFPMPRISSTVGDTMYSHPESCLSDAQVLLEKTTLPENLEALQEAAAGEGWARRRTRELKKSLRDSFRRLKRMRSIKGTPSPSPVPPNPSSRVGVRRTVTQSNRGVGRTIRGDVCNDTQNNSSDPNKQLDIQYQTTPSVEREIRERPTDSANVAIVTAIAFGPSIFRPKISSSSHLSALGSLFVGTKGGVVDCYTILSPQKGTPTKSPPSTNPSTLKLHHTKQLMLQHRAPIVTLRVLDNKSSFPFSSSAFDDIPSVTTKASVPSPELLVASEEQVRLFNLPAIRLSHKVRITAKDGFRIKAGSVVAFRSGAAQRNFTPTGSKLDAGSACTDLNHSNISLASTPAADGDNASLEYMFVFTNVGGQAVVLNLPQLSRRDTLSLLDSNDVVAVSSIVFAEPGTSLPTSSTSVMAPSIGLFQLAPGQLTLYDVVRTGQRASPLGASYRPINRLPLNQPSTSNHVITGLQSNKTNQPNNSPSKNVLPPLAPNCNAPSHSSSATNRLNSSNPQTVNGSLERPYGTSTNIR